MELGGDQGTTLSPAALGLPLLGHGEVWGTELSVGGLSRGTSGQWGHACVPNIPLCPLCWEARSCGPPTPWEVLCGRGQAAWVPPEEQGKDPSQDPGLQCWVQL